MRRGKMTAVSMKPLYADAMLRPSDELTERFRQRVGDAKATSDPDRILSVALSYAEEAEHRIAELSARVAQLEAVTVTDDLTGLLNRRGFNDVMKRNLLSAARYDEEGILAYIDLDKFKQINDRYGHPTGDDVLRAVGRYLMQNIRATDYAARLGGDEFAILFVRAQHSPARERARSLVRGINKLVIETGKDDITVRASLGIAFYDGSAQADELLTRADRAMYADKNKGSRAARMIING